MPEALALRGPETPIANSTPKPHEPRLTARDPLLEAFLAQSAGRNDGRLPTLRDWVDQAETWRIVHALRECRGNRSAAARELGIGRRTLYTKMEKLGIAPSFGTPGRASGTERR
jgi:transcriptional regulator of acetoin/glycerol metabolism